MERKRNTFVRTLAWLILVAAILSLLIFIMSKLLLADYQTDVSAASAAFNYQLALIKEDYHRAYGYLSPSLPNRPSSVEAFIEELERSGQKSPHSLNPCVWVEGVEEDGVKATVMIWEQLYTVCTRDRALAPENLSFNRFKMELVLLEDGWRIFHSEGHFVPCWTEIDGCK